MRGNLDAALDARALRRKFNAADIAKDDSTLPDAMGLYAREVFTGRPLPKSCEGLMAVWRETIADTAEEKLKQLSSLVHNQEKYGQSVHDILRDFEMSDELSEPEEGEDDEDQDASENQDEQPDQSPDTPREDGAGEAEVSEADADDSGDPQDSIDAQNIDGEQDPDAQNPDTTPSRNSLPNVPPAYAAYTTHNDEVIKAEDLCDAEELERLRGYLDGHMKGLSSVISRLANRLQRVYWRSNNAVGRSI